MSHIDGYEIKRTRRNRVLLTSVTIIQLSKRLVKYFLKLLKKIIDDIEQKSYFVYFPLVDKLQLGLKS